MARERLYGIATPSEYRIDLMRVKGKLFISGAEDRLIPIELYLDDAFRIQDTNGTELGSMDPRIVNMEPSGGNTFHLQFAGRNFGFRADEAGAGLEMFLAKLSDRQRPDSELSNGARQDTRRRPSTRGFSGVREGSVSGRKSPAVVEDISGISEPTPAGSSGPATESPAKQEEPASRPENHAGGAGPRFMRLEPKFAARLGLPLAPLRRLRKDDNFRTVDVDGVKIAYRAEGRGRPVILLGGGFGSMSIWRRVVPHLSETNHVISIDLVGFGASDRIPDADVKSYDWNTHVKYLDGCLKALGLREDLTIVSHGLNSIVALAWAQLNEERVRALCYVDAVLRPMAWPEVQPWLRDAIKLARTTDGSDYFLDSDGFVNDAIKEFLPSGSDSDGYEDYRKASGERGDARLAHMAALANVPVGGEPADAATMMRDCTKWLKASESPKLLILGRPGYLLTNRARGLASRLPHQTVATVDGVHLLPESAPDAIGRFIRLWLGTI